MTNLNPNGVLFMRSNGPSFERFFEWAAQSHHAAHSILDGNREAGQLAGQGVPYACSRIWSYEPRPPVDDWDIAYHYGRERYGDVRNLRADAQNPSTHFQVNNERGFDRALLAMYVGMIDAAMEDPEGPAGMVFWNGASGSVTNGFWKPGAPNGTTYYRDNNGWANDWALRYLYKMHEVRNVRLPNGTFAFLHGTHHYTTWYWWVALNAGQYRKKQRDRWDSLHADGWAIHEALLRGDLNVDWRLPQDHLGRDYQAIMYALGWVPEPKTGRYFIPGEHVARDINGKPVLPPWMLITEEGSDYMNDVGGIHMDQFVPMTGVFQAAADAQAETVTAQRDSLNYAMSLGLPEETMRLDEVRPKYKALQIDGMKPRGYRSLASTWAQQSWFPGASAGRIIWGWNRAVYRVIYAPTGVVVGTNDFALGATSIQWQTFNKDGDTDYLESAKAPMSQIEYPAYMLADVPYSLAPRPDEPPVPESPPPVVKPEDRWQTITLHSTGTNTRIRSKPSLDGAEVALIARSGFTLEWIPPEEMTEAETNAMSPWLMVRLPGDTQTLFVHGDYVTTDLPAPVPEVTLEMLNALRQDIVQHYISRDELKSMLRGSLDQLDSTD